MLRPSLARVSRSGISRIGTHLCRPATTAATTSKKEGDISDAFVSLSGAERPPLPDRFRLLKRDLASGREQQLVDSWSRLLRQLRIENDVIAQRGSDMIPQLDFADLEAGCDRLEGEIKKRGVVVVRGVVDEREARAYKHEVEDYVGKNPHTRAFPPHDAQVYELYWSAPQLKARAHANLIAVQRQLMRRFWHAAPDARVSLANPLSYADRLRIRQPGDASFALGPHMDGGSVERWEPEGYGRGGVYDAILAGAWERYDAWDAGGRVDAVNNRYQGLGACSVFRMWQGWLSMSRTAPHEGTLLVYPLMHLATAYVLLRPFFRPLSEHGRRPGFLDESNWVFTGPSGMTSELQGATPGHGQEVTDELHPHLELARTMVHVPEIKPGDYVAWHCDTIHAVDKTHAGHSDSSVLYIPVCPATATNAEYLARQREAFRQGTPAPDFPGGEGEARHVGRPAEDALGGAAAGRQAFGLDRLEVRRAAAPGERAVVEQANAMLGFS